MKKIIGLILLAVVASAGCTGEAKTDKGIVTPTTEMTTSTTATTVKVASASCVDSDTRLTALWENSDAIAERAWAAGITGEPAVKVAMAEDARGNVEVTRTFLARCGKEFPPSKTAEYESRIEKAKRSIGN